MGQVGAGLASLPSGVLRKECHARSVTQEVLRILMQRSYGLSMKGRDNIQGYPVSV